MHWTRRRLPNILKWSAVESKREVRSYNVTSFFSVLDPFVPNTPFLYPLKTSENRKVFRCFQGAEKGCIVNKWIQCQFSLLVTTHPFYFNAHNELEFLRNISTKRVKIQNEDR